MVATPYNYCTCVGVKGKLEATVAGIVFQVDHVVTFDATVRELGTKTYALV